MRTRQSGVTLIELMVVMVIVAILAGIGYPSYRQYVVRSNRSEAKVGLIQAAQGLERCYTQFNVYNNNTAVTGCAIFRDSLDTGKSIVTPNGYYTITGGSAVTAASYTLTATPNGAQANDTQCGNLTLDDKNVKGKTGTLTAAECWK